MTKKVTMSITYPRSDFSTLEEFEESIDKIIDVACWDRHISYSNELEFSGLILHVRVKLSNKEFVTEYVTENPEELLNNFYNQTDFNLIINALRSNHWDVNITIDNFTL